MTETCPGCGLELAAGPRATHPYIGASPSCWALYGELLAAEYGELWLPDTHRLTVDAYAVQHPGVPERRSIQSVALHLIGLCAALERGLPSERAIALLRRAAERPPELRWLEPPSPNGTITVRDVLGAADPGEHDRRVRAWAAGVWEAWSEHHATVRGWLDELARD